MSEEKTDMDICILLLESARRYSVLADEVFQTSVQPSHFANRISGQRMLLAKVVMRKQVNFKLSLSEGSLKIFETECESDNVISAWESCLRFDIMLCSVIRVLENFGPVTKGIQVGIHRGQRLMEECKIRERKKAERWQCSACGSVVETEDRKTMACPVCESGENWMVRCQI